MTVFVSTTAGNPLMPVFCPSSLVPSPIKSAMVVGTNIVGLEVGVPTVLGCVLKVISGMLAMLLTYF